MDRSAALICALLLNLAFLGCLGERPTALYEDAGGAGGKGGDASGGRGGGGAGGGPGVGGTTGSGTGGAGGPTSPGGASGAVGEVGGTGGIAATGNGGAVADGGSSSRATGSGGTGVSGGAGVSGGGAGGTAVCSNGDTQCADDAEQQTCAGGQWGPATPCTYACIGKTCGGSCSPGKQQCSSNTATELCGTNAEWEAPVTCPLASPPNPVCANGNCAYHVGYDQAGTSDSLTGGYVYAVRFQATASSRASRLGMFGTAAGSNVRLALYDENNLQEPNNLLSSTSSLPTANGAIEGPLAAATTLTAGAYYWIAAIAESTVMIGVVTGGEGFILNNNPDPWSTLPPAFPTSGESDITAETAAFYAVLQNN
jgi:hypothetical protein